MTVSDPPRYSVAGAFLDALAARDFDRLATTLTPDAAMQALVPRGLRECAGPDEVVGAFAGWFADLADFQMLEATLGEVADRLHLQWRVRVRAPRLGAEWCVVEQHVYAEPADDGRIAKLRLLCTGFRPDPDD